MREQLKRELNKTYLIFDSEGETYKESYELEMLTRNSFQTILPVHVMRMDGKRLLYFEVTCRQTLKECAVRVKLSFGVLHDLFEAVRKLMREVKEHLLDMEGVLLDMEHIYTKEGEFYFCYCPWHQKDIFQSFRELMEELLSELDYQDTEGVALAYHVYQNVCKGNFQLDEILAEHQRKSSLDTQELIKEEICFPEAEEFAEKMDIGNLYEEKSGEDIRGVKKIWNRLIGFFLKKEIQDQKLPEREAFGYAETDNETEILQTPQNETTLLENAAFRCWRLCPLIAGYEEFTVTEKHFLVGKKRESVDGYIGRETVSRIHSRLFVHEEQLYVSDMNSTNGTFVNGRQVQPGEEVEILQGDRILFADVGYECYNSL